MNPNFKAFKSDEAPEEVKPVEVPRPVETPEAPKVEEKFVGESWTVDIRNSLPDKVTEKDLKNLQVQLQKEGKVMSQVYCNDTQAEHIKELKGFSDVTLAVE